MNLNQTQLHEYNKNKVLTCPICLSSNVEANSEDINNNQYSHEIDCNDCLGTSSITFKLESVKLLSPGKLKIKKLSALQSSRYLDHSLACPVCQYDNEDAAGPSLNCDDLVVKEGRSTMDISCPCCDSSWEDCYSADSIEIVDSGKFNWNEGK